MILEVADIRIAAGQQTAFEEALRRGVSTVIAAARGYRRHRIEHGIESPERYLLMIEWDTLENHTIDFRQSEAFAAWRAIVGPFFASAPQVEHFELIDESTRKPLPGFRSEGGLVAGVEPLSNKSLMQAAEGDDA